mmetsp:Transcript_12173/g.18194  ORF Transcript_12173/g.18194 Transcript_12173/m.18194 type:complete len:495 (+) Transcript_12173:66-1550(+)|eukprot:CAMPEP_0171473606 /NCGR_PEP_ID=MMETSP0946-20130122/1940_1 /TAXON_ID=109269 /ORGANISM="Vaucheria litorea, Strain CCMP2940" /LENGTH=494 /DNA_ID=CAMNT_0012003399 /DNA_START=27 /DNA_END=1511 /DNA_ORIENTATION=+
MKLIVVCNYDIHRLHRNGINWDRRIKDNACSTGSVVSATYNATSETLATCSNVGTVLVYDARKQSKEEFMADDGGKHLFGIDLNAKGDRLITGGASQIVSYWDAMSKTYLNELKGHKSNVTSCKFLSDEHVVSGSSTGKILIHQLSHSDGANKVVSTFDDSMGIDCLTNSSKSDSVFASGNRDGEVKLWDIYSDSSGENGFEEKWFRTLSAKHSGSCTNVKFLPLSNSLIVSSGMDGKIFLSDVRDPKSRETCHLSQSILSIDIDQSEAKVVASCNDGNIYLIDFRAMENYAEMIEVSKNPAVFVAFQRKETNLREKINFSAPSSSFPIEGDHLFNCNETPIVRFNNRPETVTYDMANFIPPKVDLIEEFEAEEKEPFFLTNLSTDNNASNFEGSYVSYSYVENEEMVTLPKKVLLGFIEERLELLKTKIDDELSALVSEIEKYKQRSGCALQNIKKEKEQQILSLKEINQRLKSENDRLRGAQASSDYESEKF